MLKKSAGLKKPAIAPIASFPKGRLNVSISILFPQNESMVSG
jgi:hypothetical protein